MSESKPTLRSAQWFGTADKNGFMYRSWMKNQGIPDHEFDGRPIIGICNTWSELTPCNAHFRKLAEHVKRGIYEAGGFPVEFPVFSNGESNLRPTAMLTRMMRDESAREGLPLPSVVSFNTVINGLAQAAEARQEEAWQRAASLMEQASAVRPPCGRRVAAARVPRARRVVSMVALWPSRGPLVSRATTVQPS